MRLARLWRGLFRSRHRPFTDLKILCRRLDIEFQNLRLLQQALKHRSYLTISLEPRIASNERLELLGDAVLGLVVTADLYSRFPEEEEGGLTNLKSTLVNRKALSRFGKEIGLGEFLLLNEAEARSGGRNRDSIIADAVEALIGAIYLDGGMDAAEDFIRRHIMVRLDDVLERGLENNFKSMLQEHSQSANLSGPIYVVEDAVGPDHEKLFRVAAIVDGVKMGLGQGSSKKQAEQRAAKDALLKMNII